MYPAGHLAVAYLAGRRRRDGDRLRGLAPTLLGALVPDLIDKSIQLVGLSPYGRTFGHSVWLWASLTVLWMVARRAHARRASALGWLVVGGVSHLLVDVVDDVVEALQSSGHAFSTWGGWPYTNPDMFDWSVPHLFASRTDSTTVLEVLTLFVTWAVIVRDARSRAAGRSAFLARVLD
ncbi:MAG: metal-dependent hydrolase [Sandaracinaceae bacterium]|nr:metal-dependent hydrolase [Sandaracinaceae bacterium]